MAPGPDLAHEKPTRYPDWPVSPQDLVPLPLCEGPKLRPFDFQGPQNIDFLDEIGDGAHSVVVKVRISGVIYALKVFRFNFFSDWAWHVCEDDFRDNDRIAIFCQYQEPFNAECRAYGRLEESGHTNLSIKCYGYVLLDEEHEKALLTKLSADKGREVDLCGHGYSVTADKKALRTSVLGARTGRPPPIRCLVKELGEPLPIDESQWAGKKPPYPTHRSVTPILKNIKLLHELGIINLDVRADQVINGKFADFSTAMTAPHYLMTPRLNPHISSGWVSRMKESTFGICVRDYLEYDSEVVAVLREYGLPSNRQYIKLPWASPRGTGRRRQDDPAHEPEQRGRFYTYIDPSLLLDRRHSGAPRRGRRSSKQAWPLARKPPRWYVTCGPELTGNILRGLGGYVGMDWTYRDGHMWPIKAQHKTVEQIADWTKRLHV